MDRKLFQCQDIAANKPYLSWQLKGDVVTPCANWIEHISAGITTKTSYTEGIRCNICALQMKYRYSFWNIFFQNAPKIRVEDVKGDSSDASKKMSDGSLQGAYSSCYMYVAHSSVTTLIFLGFVCFSLDPLCTLHAHHVQTPLSLRV